MSFICFDLEGPLSPEDNAYNLMKSFEGGDKVFEFISRYDDLLTLEEKEGYEPGDTLALITPFLVYHGIREQNIIDLANKATLVQGSKELVSYLNSKGWKVYCISTSYKQYAMNITRRVGISPDNIACTNFPINELARRLANEDFSFLTALEREIYKQSTLDDAWIKKNFDKFYWQELPKTGFGFLLDVVKPIGGQRKVEALKRFASMAGEPLSNCAVIGDSITDFKMLKEVNGEGGLAIAFNGNEYVLPYATMGLASINIFDLYPVIDVWKDGNRSKVEEWVRANENLGKDNRNNFKWLLGVSDISIYLQVHKKMRKVVREDAAKLG